MERSDPLISIAIVSKRIQKKKRNQTIPQAVLRLAKTTQAQYDYNMRETVENDNDVILDENNDNAEEEIEIADDNEDDVDIGLD